MELQYDKCKLLGKQVYLDIGETVGETVCTVINQETHKIIAVGIQTNDNVSFLNIIPLQKILYFDDEAVIILSKKDIIPYNTFFTMNLEKNLKNYCNIKYKL